MKKETIFDVIVNTFKDLLYGSLLVLLSFIGGISIYWTIKIILFLIKEHIVWLGFITLFFSTIMLGRTIRKNIK